jgi:hypothetical protein
MKLKKIITVSLFSLLTEYCYCTQFKKEGLGVEEWDADGRKDKYIPGLGREI